jgi:hypothetical protein
MSAYDESAFGGESSDTRKLLTSKHLSRPTSLGFGPGRVLSAGALGRNTGILRFAQDDNSKEWQLRELGGVSEIPWGLVSGLR